MGAPLRFSVVTPSYNQAASIGQTIESVLSQEGNLEIEYFIFDGGSTDGSVEVIRRYADAVARGSWPVHCAGIQLHWVSERDRGQADAINRGFRRATGAIVSWLNSDDYYYPSALARVGEAFARLPQADFIYGDGDVVDGKGKVAWPWLSRPFNLAVLTSYHYLWNDFSNYIMQQATFWRRSVFDRIGFLDESFHFALDVEYWVRAGAAGMTLCHLPEKLAAFRWVEGTKSLSGPTVFWEDYLEIFRRHRGAGRLETLFGYYYYNVARQAVLGSDHAPLPQESWAATVDTAEKRLFVRWDQLNEGEKGKLRSQSARGRDLCRLLLANELLDCGAAEEARPFYRQAVAARPLLAMHPLGLWYLARAAVGSRAGHWLTLAGKMAVNSYRRYRYDYRLQA